MPTGSNCYLYFDSCHSININKSITSSQCLCIRPFYSDTKNYYIYIYIYIYIGYLANHFLNLISDHFLHHENFSNHSQLVNKPRWQVCKRIINANIFPSYKVIITIKTCWEHRFPWFSLAILPYQTSYWRCPWCSCYRRRKWTRRHEFKSYTRLIAFHIALIPLGKVWIQLFSLQLWVNSRTD